MLTLTSYQKLHNFLENSKERQEHGTGSAPPPLAPPQSQSNDDQKDVNRSSEDAGFKGRNELYQPGDGEMHENCALSE